MQVDFQPCVQKWVGEEGQEGNKGQWFHAYVIFQQIIFTSAYFCFTLWFASCVHWNNQVLWPNFFLGFNSWVEHNYTAALLLVLGSGTNLLLQLLRFRKGLKKDLSIHSHFEDIIINQFFSICSFEFCW